VGVTGDDLEHLMRARTPFEIRGPVPTETGCQNQPDINLMHSAL